MKPIPVIKSNTPKRHRGKMTFLMVIVIAGLTGWFGFIRADSPGAVRSNHDQIYRSLALNGPNYRDVVGYYTYCRKAVGSDTSTCLDKTRHWSQQLTLKTPFDKIAEEILNAEALLAEGHKARLECASRRYGC